MSDRAHGQVGRRVLRKEDSALVTGKARYTDDLKLPGMLHMAVLRSPMAHARIRSPTSRRRGGGPASSPRSPGRSSPGSGPPGCPAPGS